MKDNELEQFIAERNAALETMDMKYFKEQLGPRASDAMLLASAHKARHHCTDIADELRWDSAKWLVSMGLKDMNGCPVDMEKLPI